MKNKLKTNECPHPKDERKYLYGFISHGKRTPDELKCLKCGKVLEKRPYQ